MTLVRYIPEGQKAKIKVMTGGLETGFGSGLRGNYWYLLAEREKMTNRLTVIWLAVLTVFVSFTITDYYRILKKVETGQYYTMLYMEKSADILRKIKHSSLEQEETPDSHPIASAK